MQGTKPWSKPYRFALVATAGILVLSYFGFRTSYWTLFPEVDATGWQVHFHVLTIVLWLGMLVAQARLAYVGRIDAHKRIGRWSYVLVPIILIGFVLVTDFGQRRHKEAALLGATLFDAGLFLLCYGMAILRRRNSTEHSRYMMLTPVAFLNPALGRAIAPEVSVPVQLVLLLTILIVARVRKQPWMPYAVVLAGWFALMLVVIFISVIQPGIMEGLWEMIWG